MHWKENGMTEVQQRPPRQWSQLFVTTGLVGCIIAVCMRVYQLEQRIERLEEEPLYLPPDNPPRRADNPPQHVDDLPHDNPPRHNPPVHDDPPLDKEPPRAEASESDEEEAPPVSESVPAPAGDEEV